MAALATWAALAVAQGCGELSKLIPAQPLKPTAGLDVRDFRSSFEPTELMWDRDGQLYGLRSDLGPATEKFARNQEVELTTALRDFATLTDPAERLRLLGSDQKEGPERFMGTLPKLPSIFEVGGDISRFQKETPNVKTDLTAALNPENAPRLVVNRVSQVFEFTAEELNNRDFAVFETPGLVFAGLATKFDENTRPADEAGIAEAAEKAATGWTVTRVRSVVTYARSLQPSNEFQALLECANVTLVPPAAQPSEAVSLAWPRLLIRESSPSMLDRPKKNLGVAEKTGSTEPSQLRIEHRPGLFVTRASGNEDSSPQWLLATAPPRDEILLVREPAAVTVRWSRLRYDGAGNSQNYSLFHEARQFFLYRFLFTDVSTFRVRALLAPFRIPFASSLARVDARRNEFGQWRRALSPSQQTFVKNGLDTQTTPPPQDRWTTLQALYATTGKGERRSLSRLRDTSKNGVAAIDTMNLGGELGSIFLQPTIRNSAADSALVSREKYSEIEALCRRAFF